MAEHAQARRPAEPAIHGSQGTFAAPQASALSGSAAVQRLTALSERINRPSPAAVQRMPGSDGGGGLPQGLRSGIESLSGLSMAGVRVHRNSDRPAQLQALAYTQGTDIHLAPGQDRHLPHEAWHVVQQMQGRVAATRQLQAGVPLNDDFGLEREADIMGSRAAGYSAGHADSFEPAVQRMSVPGAVLQRMGEIRFANVSNKPAARGKAESIIRVLRETPYIQGYLGNKNVLITLEENPDLATVAVVGDQVQISLAPWFFNHESRGTILGLLAHEFGVHPIASSFIGKAGLDAEKIHIQNDTSFPTELKDHHIGFHDPENPERKVQSDHVFVVQKGSPRSEVYFNTVRQMATIMLTIIDGNQNNDNHSRIDKKHVSDLIYTYLSDLATIIATKDNRRNAYSARELVAQSFNQQITHWKNSLGKSETDNDLIHLTPEEVNHNSVKLAIFKVGAGLFGSKITGDGAVMDNTVYNIPKNDPSGINPVQKRVLEDHGMNMTNDTNQGTDFFEAITSASGLVNAREKYLLLSEENGTKDLISKQQAVKSAVTEMQLKDINEALPIGVRILMPNGNMVQSGAKAPVFTIVWSNHPTSHYRGAR